MKFFILLICSIVEISIQIQNEQHDPIKDLTIKNLHTEDSIEINNSLTGLALLPLDWEGSFIYIGSPGYEGVITQIKDTTIVLKSTKYRQ